MMLGTAPAVAVVGPTGSGKSDLALRLAAEFGGEVVNCDSVQVYRQLNIGAAKLLEPERRGIPHHLIDVRDPDAVFSAGEYAREARLALAGITARGRLPIVTGGTGFYLRALIDGLFEGPERDEALRGRLARRETRVPGWLHRLLARHDPETAARIHATDIQKLVRACEILLLTRQAPSALFRQGRDRLEGYRWLKLGLDPPREELYRRINLRCRRMFECGLVEETEGIISRGYSAAIKPLDSVGYREALQVLRGEATREAAIEAAQAATRHYAKRQWTWFRRDPEVVWLAGFGDELPVQEQSLQRVSGLLQNVQPVP